MKQSIPSEILRQVFKYLSEDDLKNSVFLTCKQWRNVLLNFGLVEATLMLNSPYMIKNILSDFKVNPGFGRSVSEIVIKEDVSWRATNTEEGQRAEIAGNVVDNFRSIIQLCPNVKSMEVSARYSSLFDPIIKEIILTEGELKSQIQVLALEFPKNNEEPINVDIGKLVSKTIPSLRELTICSRTEGKNITFTTSSLYCSNTSILRVILISCHHSFMTRACIKYIISGRLVNLEELYLYLTLVDSIDENKNIIDLDIDDEIYTKLKDFCRFSLESYSITLADRPPDIRFPNYDSECEDETFFIIDKDEDNRYNNSFYNSLSSYIDWNLGLDKFYDDF